MALESPSKPRSTSKAVTIADPATDTAIEMARLTLGNLRKAGNECYLNGQAPNYAFAISSLGGTLLNILGRS